MPEAASNTIEISNFVQVARQPTPDRRNQVSQVGQAMVALLEAEKALSETLIEIAGQRRSKIALAPLKDGVFAAWDRIDEVLSRKRGS